MSAWKDSHLCDVVTTVPVNLGYPWCLPIIVRFEPLSSSASTVILVIQRRVVLPLRATTLVARPRWLPHIPLAFRRLFFLTRPFRSQFRPWGIFPVAHRKRYKVVSNFWHFGFDVA